MAGYGSAEYYLHRIYEELKNGTAEQPIQSVPPSSPAQPIPPVPEKRAVLHKYATNKSSGTQTITDTVPAGEQWVVQAASCWTDRTVKSIALGARDKGGHITELAYAEQARDTSIRWCGEIILQEKEAIVMVIENNPGSNGAQYRLAYRGYYE